MQNIFENINPGSFAPPKALWVKVFHFLRDAIVKGDIRPGEKLNEAFIASKLGISRSPVREAIRVLEAENFVETIAQRGPFVKVLTIQEVKELYVVLVFLQGAAIQLAVTNMNAKREQELRCIIQDLREARGAVDIEELKILSHRFHNFIIQASCNNLLIKMNESLFFQQERLRLWGASTDSKDVDAIMDEHIQISEALLRRDTAEADRLMKEHVDHARARILKTLARLEKSNKAGRLKGRQMPR